MVSKSEILWPPIDVYSDETDVFRVTWSSSKICDSCGRFTRRGLIMLEGSARRWEVCGMTCLRRETDGLRRQRADMARNAFDELTRRIRNL